MNRSIYIGIFWIIFGSSFFMGCTERLTKDDLTRLNGYWEIEKVVFPDGNSKEYRVNTTIDYLEVKGMQGIRKKVQPKFGGKYETSDDAEAFEISGENGNFVLRYTTELSTWSETLLALEKDAFSVRNEEGTRYDYKRFEPIGAEVNP